MSEFAGREVGDVDPSSYGRSLSKASNAAYDAADNFNAIFVKDKHLNVGSGNYAKFTTPDVNVARIWV